VKAEPIVVMGVSGSGKSTVGRLLAERLGRRFVDADDLHPEANVEKMANGLPLTDDDRWPWLDAVSDALVDRAPVVACSALRRVYRDRLRVRSPELRLVFLAGTALLIADRVDARDHFMPTSLLASQLATLEPPTADEHAVVVDIGSSPDDLVAQVVARLSR